MLKTVRNLCEEREIKINSFLGYLSKNSKWNSDDHFPNKVISFFY